MGSWILNCGTRCDSFEAEFFNVETRCEFISNTWYVGMIPSGRRVAILKLYCLSEPGNLYQSKPVPDESKPWNLCQMNTKYLYSLSLTGFIILWKRNCFFKTRIHFPFPISWHDIRVLNSPFIIRYMYKKGNV